MSETPGAARLTIDERYVGWMGQALDIASRALASGDVPVGALVLSPAGEVLGVGHNVRDATGDPPAHAEVVAIRAAAPALRQWLLGNSTLVVTPEPCERVRLPQACLYPCGCLDKPLVPGRVPQSVVSRLESVAIHVHESTHLIVASRPGECLIDAVHQHHPVR